MEILPRYKRPRTYDEMYNLVVSGTWLMNEITQQVFKLEKLSVIQAMPTYWLCVQLPGGHITMTDILVFPSFDGLHIIEPDYSKKQVPSLFPHAVKHQWVPFSQLEIIISL